MFSSMIRSMSERRLGSADHSDSSDASVGQEEDHQHNDAFSEASTHFDDIPLEPEQSPANTLARQETKTVHRLRVLLLIFLLSVAILASLGVFLFSRNQEEDEFKAGFTGQGQKVIDGFQDDSFRKLQALDSLSNSFTSYAEASGSKWPFVTMPHSASHFEPYLSLTNAAALNIFPIVGRKQRLEWEEYVVNNQAWIADDISLQASRNEENQSGRRILVTENEIEVPTDQSWNGYSNGEVFDENAEVSNFIKNYVGVDTSAGPWIVWWQYAPVIPNRWFVNFNRLAYPGFKKEAEAVQKEKAVISSTWAFEPGLDFQSTRDFDFTSELLAAGGNDDAYEAGEPISYLYYPVFDNLEGKRQTTAILSATLYWRSYFEGILPENVNGIHAVVENSQGQVFTYELNGEKAFFLGPEDLHESKYDKFEMAADYSSFVDNVKTGQRHGKYTGLPVDDDYISYRIRVYPSAQFEDSFLTPRPYMYAAAMVFIFLFTATIFLFYDWFVERRQKKVMSTAVKTTAVVSALFPENVRERLMEEATQHQNAQDKLGKFMNGGKTEDSKSSKPIADFFPETTIMFSDIVGFTAWSSVREPTQVFILLETLYNAFDLLAKHRRVFKVETIGDCYVAVTGLPKPRKDHAVAMARFASQCLDKVHELTRELELELGPGTADLTMRFGLHSGPVTAGVLRGEKSRFQLFGDTMNTASRMESTSLRDKIQISEETAKLLQAAGKSHWISKREEKIVAKGKGEMQTYWLTFSRGTGPSSGSSSGGSSEGSSTGAVDIISEFETMAGSGAFEAKRQLQARLSDSSNRLVNWNVEVLRKLLQQIVARRNARSSEGSRYLDVASSRSLVDDSGTVLEEVQEIIKLPDFDIKSFRNQKDPSTVQLGPEVEQQLRDFVSSVSCMYKENAFHNFEHASHVSMSVNKLLSRIVAPTDIEYDVKSSMNTRASTLHDHTYGITSDPLTQFACVFSALIHDADHTGVPNTQLIQENAAMGARYNNRSVAEQNSVDLCWALLMEDQYKDLRATIYANEVEFRRFRQLVVNSVMATDIMDKELKQARNERWDKAFSSSDTGSSKSLERDNINRKATIVIEHLIQSSDVAHTMQHWHVYRRWNERLFQEMSHAYHEGRSKTDPATTWYKGELGFFDFYIIPLAKKLKNCGVFGVSSDEYLKYAENNRREWEEKGEMVVAEMVENFKNVEKKERKVTPPGEDAIDRQSLEQRLMKQLGALDSKLHEL